MGSADLTPLMRRGFELAAGICEITFCESDMAAGEGRAGGHPAALKHRGDPPQFVGCRPGTFEVSDCDRDLHLRLQERGAPELRIRRPLFRWHGRRTVEGVANGRCGSGGVAVRQMDQRKTRLRVPSGTISGQECLLGALDISLPESNAAKLGQRPPELPPQVGAKLLACEQGFLLGLRARSTQSENFGAVDATASMEASDRLPVVPAFHGFRPLLGKVVLPQCL